MLKEDITALYTLYNKIKNQIRREYPAMYANWQAGGFVVDQYVFTNYDTLDKIKDMLDNHEEFKDEDEEGWYDPYENDWEEVEDDEWYENDEEY